MNEFKKYIDFFDKRKEYGDFCRLGKLFKTDKQHYMYDLGTGKVVQCTPKEFCVLDHIFDNNGLEKCEDIPMEKQELEMVLAALKDNIDKENLLMAPKVNAFSGQHNDLKAALDHELKQVTLELTQRCNLRCKYCANGESFHQANENGTAKDMPLEIAKAAIDYLFSHSDNEIAVTFYGGEPLLQFEAMKELIEYSKKKNESAKKDLTFSMTTNLVLMTREVARYLASVGEFAVLCSIDGPETMHDTYRIMHDGKGSFTRAIAGLKILVEEYGEDAATLISINGVLTPPYASDKFDAMQDFYQNLDWLPKDLSIQTTYVKYREGSELDHIFKEAHGDIEEGRFSPLNDWVEAKSTEEEELFCKDFETNIYLYIHKREIYDKPVEGYSLNGCCVPGAQRLYVTVDGDYTVCERVDNAPKFGNIHIGIDEKLIEEYYLKNYIKDCEQKCSKCWAVRLCKLCFVDCFNSNREYDSALKQYNCQQEKELLEMQLIKYHQLMEEKPEKLEPLNAIYLR